MSMLTCISSWLPGSSQSNASQTSHDVWAGSIAGATLGKKIFIFQTFSSCFDLDEKLNHLDAMYSDRRDDLTSMHNLSTEEKLLLFQKNIELRTRENLQQQVSRSLFFLLLLLNIYEHFQ